MTVHVVKVAKKRDPTCLKVTGRGGRPTVEMIVVKVGKKPNVRDVSSSAEESPPSLHK